MLDSFDYVDRTWHSILDRTWHSILDRTWRSFPTDHLGSILLLLLKRGPDSQVKYYNYILQTTKGDNAADYD